MNAPTGLVYPYKAKSTPVLNHFDGRWIKRVLMGVIVMDTGLQPKLRSIIDILRLSTTTQDGHPTVHLNDNYCLENKNGI
jgi:hypothetical protein